MVKTKVYKEKQFLVFDFEDGKMVKYDFATKQSIGKKGEPVKKLCSQLSGYSVEDIMQCCVDQQYAEFLRFIRHCEKDKISNIGTILGRVPYYANYEQFFSAGLQDIISSRRELCSSISDIPKGLINLCKIYNLKLTDKIIDQYKKNPDIYHVAYGLRFESLTISDITGLLDPTTSTYINYDRRGNLDVSVYGYIYGSVIINLINNYGYKIKSLLNYFDYLKTYEALDNVVSTAKELFDYVNMMSQISNKYDKYPKHFLTTHQIAVRNYNRLKKVFEENKFKNRINKDYERTFGEYRFIYPNSTQDIKDEAAQQSNCVASYIDRVINGDCHILFLREKNSLDKSLVTIEVRDNKIVQAKRKFNYPVTKAEQDVIDKWNAWQESKNKEAS